MGVRYGVTAKTARLFMHKVRETMKSSCIKDFKAISTINAEKTKLETIITDVSNYVNWCPDISKSTVFKKNKQQRIYCLLQN